MLSAAVVAGAEQRDRPAVSGASARHDVTLVYVGADDCPPCISWQRGAGASFRASPEFAQLTYREVKSPTLLDVLKDEYWPHDLRAYRDRLDRGAGVPLWLVVVDHEIVEHGFGAARWSEAILPRLKSLLR
jgi:hypothetical protein